MRGCTKDPMFYFWGEEISGRIYGILPPPIPLGGRRAVLYNNSIGQSGDDPRAFANSRRAQVCDIWSSGAHPCVVPGYFHFQNISSLSALGTAEIAEQLVVATLPYLGNFQKLWRFLWQLGRCAECTFKVKVLNHLLSFRRVHALLSISIRENTKWTEGAM